ncbi:MAG: clan AA aspartic protease [Verrucomicrobiota bacterium]
MGQVHVTAQLSDLAENHPPYEEEFLVDTGAIDCMAPGDQLRLAGMAVEGENIYELASGESDKYEYGFARGSFMGFETVTQVMFGPDACEPIIGVVALENVGISVDPVSRTLKKVAARPLKRL